MSPSSLSSLLLILLSPLLSTAFTFTDEDPLIQEVVSRDNNNNNQDDLLLNAENKFLEFKTKYRKTYPTQEEDDYRFGVFISNLRIAKRHQELDPTAVHGVTKFSDLTMSEFGRRFSGSSSENDVRLSEDCKPAKDLSLEGLPRYWNWVENKTVTRVKDQTDDCDGCWAFSTIAVLEGAHALANNKLVELSEQQLIDCSRQSCKANKPRACNDGCNGGYRVLAFKNVKKRGGVVKAKEYPFKITHKNSTCRIENKFTALMDDYFCIHQEAQYRPHLYRYGPIAVNIEKTMLQDYQGGVLCRKSEINDPQPHAVTVVGYNFTGSVRSHHFIVKNSWGKDWGEKGFFKVCRGIIEQKDLGIYAIAKKKTSLSY